MARPSPWVVTRLRYVDRIVSVQAETAQGAKMEAAKDFHAAPSELVVRTEDAADELVKHRAWLVVDELKARFAERREEPWQYEQLERALEKIIGPR